MTTRARKRHAHRQRPRGLSLDQEDDHLLHTDPSLMTERQQLAFLLKTTAHEAWDASKASDDSPDSSDSEPEPATPSPRRVKRARRIRGQAAEQSPARRGRGRPPKSARSPRASELRVTTTAHRHHRQESKKHEAKPSPSSSSDVAQLDAAFPRATPRCVLCCDYETAYEASFSGALFLCPTCDRKYPTQQALGRMCMT